MQSHQQMLSDSGSITKCNDPFFVSHHSSRYILRELFVSLSVLPNNTTFIGIVLDYLTPTVGVMTDESCIKILEEKYSAAMQEVNKQVKMREQEAKENERRHNEFSDLICHQILNSLHGIAGALDWLDSARLQLSSLTSLSPKIPNEIARIAETQSIIQKLINSQKQQIALNLKRDALLAVHSTAQKNCHPNMENKLSGLSVLIVDDIRLNRKILAKMLQGFGCKYQEASDGQEAVNKIVADNNIDVVLMDVNMPIMDGITATRMIREITIKRASMPVIIGASADISSDQINAAIDAGMKCFIPKPYRREDIFQAILNTKQTNLRMQHLSVITENPNHSISSDINASTSSSPSTGSSTNTSPNANISASPNTSGLSSIVLVIPARRSSKQSDTLELPCHAQPNHWRPTSPAMQRDFSSSTLSRDSKINSPSVPGTVRQKLGITKSVRAVRKPVSWQQRSRAQTV